MFLFDTNILSELLRARPDPRVETWVRARPGAAISVITIEEMAFGIASAPRSRRAKLARWFEELQKSILEIHDVTPAIARAAGELRAARLAAGRTVHQADMLIAATALVDGLTLVTRNVSDFEDCGVVVFDPFT